MVLIGACLFILTLNLHPFTTKKRGSFLGFLRAHTPIHIFHFVSNLPNIQIVRLQKHDPTFIFHILYLLPDKRILYLTILIKCRWQIT